MILNPKNRDIITDNGQKKESIGNKDSAWKNDISEKKELLSPLCNKQQDDSPRRWKNQRTKNDIKKKINELDRLLLLASQMTKNEVTRFMKKTKNDNECWITLRKKM